MTCNICLEDLKDGDETKELHCGHSYHKECLETWFTHAKGQKTCPTCRVSVNTFELKYLNDYNLIYGFKTSALDIEFKDIVIPVSQIINAGPGAWISDENKIYHLPAYLLKQGDKSYYISSYLRSCLIFSKFNKYEIYSRKDVNGIELYCTHQEIEDQKNNFEIYQLWTINIILSINNFFNLKGGMTQTTMVIDLVLLTFKNYFIGQSYKNIIFLASIFTSTKIYIENIPDYYDYTISHGDLLKYIASFNNIPIYNYLLRDLIRWQHKFLSNKLSKKINLSKPKIFGV